MKKDVDVFIDHILSSIELIELYVANQTKETFLNSPQLQDSIVRRLEILGEAVKNIPDEFKDQHPHIPWKKIAGMRDMLIHQYFGIDFGLTWKVVKKDIPEIKKMLISIRGRLK